MKRSVSIPIPDIQERHGTVPLWLKIVVFGLLAWSVYYTIRYWSGD